MTWIWVVIAAALIFLSFRFTYKLGYRRGFRNGGLKVTGEWKKWMITLK